MSDHRLVELRGVSKGFGTGGTRVEVLKDLDFEIQAGQLLAVVGPSGVGKSTLLHLIGLLDRPDEVLADQPHGQGQVLEVGSRSQGLDRTLVLRPRGVSFPLQALPRTPWSSVRPRH